MKKQLILAVKGALMGAANVIPGVSGGTIALLTNIFEKLVISIRSFDIKAVRLLLSGQFRAFAAHIHLDFLLPLGVGVLISILSFSHLLKYLFEHHQFYVWSFFFGLILASVLSCFAKFASQAYPAPACFWRERRRQYRWRFSRQRKKTLRCSIWRSAERLPYAV